jgi:vacuolar-type H+-ATPase subunit I/STV1
VEDNSPNTLLNEILGLVPSPQAATGGLVDNWQTAFLWLATGIVVFALIALYFGFKRGLRGEHVNKGMLPYIKWPLLFASAGFNVFFTYYVFLPAGQPVAMFAAIVMGGVNLAEAYLVRLIIATWRHDMKTVFQMALLFTLPVFMYSLMAAGSSFSTMMNKNKDSLAASQLELQAAQDRIKQANAQVQEA